MNHPPTPKTDAKLESLLFEALQLRDEQGLEALDRFLAQHPEHAPRLCKALASLQRLDLLNPTKTAMPKQLGEFAIQRQLGAGAMGVVYLAEQSSLGREVALKVVRPELLMFEGARERFQREIDAVAKLEHPSIVPILATGEADGVPFYAMPRLPGASGEAVRQARLDHDPRTLRGSDLRNVLREPGEVLDESGDIDSTFTGTWWQAVVRLMRKIALGIHHAHTRGVLHRDLKPSNVMFSADGRATVLDFGLARAQGDASLTRTGAAAGSPAYMSPEQVRDEPIDERTDVYGLGATLYCLLALQPPFRGQSLDGLRDKILTGTRADLQKRCGIPSELRIVIDCAMDLERTRRYPSAAKFADDLKAVLDGTSISARRLPLLVQTRRFAQRHRTLVATLSVCAGFVVLVPLLLLWQQQAANKTLQQQVTRSDQSVAISIDAADRLVANVAKQKLRNAHSPHLLSASLLQDALSMFGQLELDERYRDRVAQLKVNALHELSKVRLTLGDEDACEACCRELIDYVRATYQDASVPDAVAMRCGNAHTMLVQLHWDRGNREGMEESLNAARTIASEQLRRKVNERQARHEMSRVLSFDAMLAAAEGQTAVAEATYQKAIANIDEAPIAGPRHTLVASTRLHYAMFLKGQRRLGQAKRLIEEVIQSLTGVADAEYPWPVPRMMLCTARNERFRLLDMQKDHVEAEQEAHALLETLDQVVLDYPDVLDPYQLRGLVRSNLALIQARASRCQPAERNYRMAINDLELVLKKGPHLRAAAQFLRQARTGLSWCLRATKQWHELVPAAKALAAAGGPARDVRTAARDLLRAAANLPKQRDALESLAIDFFVKAHQAGAKITATDSLYEPLRQNPRFLQLTTPPQKKN